ncbi:hypothetical protein PF005_g9130 [Phytophthora fragariae]|uniref:Uncharacterized protein n=1 Tax=Phytophthora fragariae TaxID=53985 RepID=A0A6A3U7Q7_9STRA|nr:hypothetical protein PF006_g8037 [Phytophthora fragariae]KAE9216279.1 hypothetical protein PF005_g9130 [Phytophthora fragariae]KAE9298760.1 hypothetical protein PF008_g23421 [Phytophthora fragariae]
MEALTKFFEDNEHMEWVCSDALAESTATDAICLGIGKKGRNQYVTIRNPGAIAERFAENALEHEFIVWDIFEPNTSHKFVVQVELDTSLRAESGSAVTIGVMTNIVVSNDEERDNSMKDFGLDSRIAKRNSDGRLWR